MDKVRDCEVGVDGRERADIRGEVDRVMTGSVDAQIGTVVLDIGVGGDMSVSLRRRVTITATAVLHTHTTTDPTDTSPLTHPVAHPLAHDVVFWNPWVDKARALADLGDLDYISFVCVEPGTVSDWVSVTPAQTLTLTQTLTSTCM